MAHEFCHLHVHSEYSLLDGLPSVNALAAHAASLNQRALALTDHGVLFGALEFYKACQRANVKPILGMEAYLARGKRTDREGDAYHLLLLAETDEGYRNLMRLATAAQLEGFYRHPRIDKELLAEHSAGLICTSGCLASEIPDLLRANRVHEARAAVEWYRDVFPKRFYLELQQHEGLKELEPINRQLVEWSHELELPLIATCDAHYLRAQDADAHDVLLCVQTGKTLDDPKRLRMTSRDYYLKSTAEMWELCQDVPSALANTMEIAERCNVDLSFKGYRLPRFPTPQGHSPETYLRALCEAGIARRYESATDTIRRRCDHELAVIHAMGFDAYFLIVWDLVRYARENGIWFNVRGSAASSLVAYALGITSIEPLSNHLLFERFLNPDRVSMPDIDLDFPDDERARILNYVVARYGQAQVAQIATFGRMMAKGAARDVARVMGYSAAETNRVAKLIPNAAGQTLQSALAESSELNALYESDERAQRLIDAARALEGVTRNVSTHPAGVVIADRPIVEYAPLHRATSGSVENGVPITQYAANELERIGLLKIDLLGLATLSVMRNVCALVQRQHGIIFDLSNIPIDDPDAFALLARGETLGVFQVESQGLRDVLVQMKPTRFEQIVAAIALYRPGPLQYIPTYIKRLHGKEAATYLHPSLEPILGETYGIIVFQESIMQIARDCCGFTGAEADILRKAVSKKNKAELLAQREKFVRGAMEHAGMTQEIAEKLFDDIEYFARYAFNRAHAANYAALTCQTAYLKAHYLLEYLWALFNNEQGDFDKLALLVSEARRAGMDVLPPDVRYSDVNFSIEPERRAIRYGLGAIKNVGQGAAESIVNARRAREPFSTLADFCAHAPLKQINRRALEALIGAGALDAFGERAALLQNVERLIAYSGAAAQLRDGSQLSMFANDAQELTAIELPNVPPMTPTEKGQSERELMGVAFSDDALERLRAALRERKQKIWSSVALAELDEKNGLAATAGIVKSVRKTKTKKGEPMAFVRIEDAEGEVELVVFPRAYANSSGLLRQDTAILVEGRAQKRDDAFSFIVERIQPLFENRTEVEGEDARPLKLPTDAEITSSKSADNSTLPPLRRAPSVFGTRGSEIIARAAMQVTPRARQVDAIPEPSTKIMEAQEPTEQRPSEAKRRRVCIHFRELPPEDAAAYVRPLFHLFNDYAGDDEIALLFDRSDGSIKIGAPHGVDYDAIADAVATIIGDDAVVEIL